jgi:glycine/D-amino acid oxidase-like deaminating enzyme
VLLDRGVVIHELTPVQQLKRGTRVVAVTPSGSVHADHAVIALNAWASAWRPFRRRMVTGCKLHRRHEAGAE